MRLLPIILLLAALAQPMCTEAQPIGGKARSRPALAAGRDSNSANDYYRYGLTRLPGQPGEAANAFYWAYRLDPTSADALYGLRIALLMDDRRFIDYIAGVERIGKHPDIVRIDSLYYRAMLRNPFVDRRLDQVMLEEFFMRITDGDPTLVNRVSGEPRIIAWQAYGAGNFVKAAAQYARAIKREPKSYWLREDRARTLFFLTQFDSTVAELTKALEVMRAREEKKLVYSYDSKAMVEYSIGIAQAQKGDLDAAREAFGRALVEDLSFYMGHSALGDVALMQGDTATALAELDLAVQLKEDDPAVRFSYGAMLLQGARFGDAVTQLRKTVELEPYFARPYFYLAYAHDALAQNAEALANYRAFIQRAPASAATELAHSSDRVAALAQAPAAPPGGGP